MQVQLACPDHVREPQKWPCKAPCHMIIALLKASQADNPEMACLSLQPQYLDLRGHQAVAA